jgi:hypothetical protein
VGNILIQQQRAPHDRLILKMPNAKSPNLNFKPSLGLMICGNSHINHASDSNYNKSQFEFAERSAALNREVKLVSD